MDSANVVNIIKVGIFLMALSCVSACGQKGKLYLPPENVGTSFPDFSNTV